jgi:hypothetical protein
MTDRPATNEPSPSLGEQWRTSYAAVISALEPSLPFHLEITERHILFNVWRAPGRTDALLILVGRQARRRPLFETAQAIITEAQRIARLEETHDA